MKSDKNNDQTISRGEANLLSLRIRIQLHEYGVEFNSDKFVQFIGNNSSVNGVIALAQKLLQPEDTGDTSEGNSENEDLRDMFYVTNNDLTTIAAGGKVSRSTNRIDPGARVSL